MVPSTYTSTDETRLLSVAVILTGTVLPAAKVAALAGEVTDTVGAVVSTVTVKPAVAAKPPRISVLVVLFTNMVPLVKATVAVPPVAAVLKLSVATSWSPVSVAHVVVQVEPSARFIVPLPLVFWAVVPKAVPVRLTLTSVNKLDG